MDTDVIWDVAVEPLVQVEEETAEGADEGSLTIDYPKEHIIIEKNDRSLSELHRWYQAGRVIIDSEWQRSYVWDTPRASRLIESLLVDIPIPVIYLAKNESGKYEIIDGVQRLS